LDASLTTRALRRYEELESESDQSLATVEKDMQRRDTNDSTRSLAPLKPADDAIVIDSTDLSVQEVVDRMLSRISEKG
jgi:cytidylate kinase